MLIGIVVGYSTITLPEGQEYGMYALPFDGMGGEATWNVAVVESDSDWNPAVGNIILATAGADPWTFTFNADGSALGSITGDNGTGGIFAQKTAWTVTMTAQLLNEDTTPAGQFTKTIDGRGCRRSGLDCRPGADERASAPPRRCGPRSPSRASQLSC